MRLLSIGLAVSLLAAGHGEALASRFYCAADDRDIKMALESDYRESEGQALMHFRGIVMLKDAAASPLLKELKLTSKMLTQSWLDDRSLRLRVYTEKEAWRSFATLDLTLEAGASGTGNRLMQGRYVLSVEWSRSHSTMKRDTARYDGSLSCRYE